MIPYLLGALLYATASRETLTPEKREERIRRMDRDLKYVSAGLAGAVVGGLVVIALHVNTPRANDLKLETKVQQVQIYDAGSNSSR